MADETPKNPPSSLPPPQELEELNADVREAMSVSEGELQNLQQAADAAQKSHRLLKRVARRVRSSSEQRMAAQPEDEQHDTDPAPPDPKVSK